MVGFVKNPNTENAGLDFLENSVTAMDESKECLAVFIDLAKTFDIWYLFSSISISAVSSKKLNSVSENWIKLQF